MCVRACTIIHTHTTLDTVNTNTKHHHINPQKQLHYYFSQLFKGDSVQMTLLRDGEIMEVSVPVYIHKLAVAPHLNNGMPSYLMVRSIARSL